MARATTVKASIRSNTSESVTVDSTSWSAGDNGTITLSATVPAAVNVGDLINDSAGNDYIITDISGAVLTCQDFGSTTDPATGAATITEAYDTPILWEADLDDTIIYRSSDIAQGEGYNNGTQTGNLTINGGGTVGLASRVLTVPVGERNDGTAGTGAVLNSTTGSPVSVGVANTTIEWWEITHSGTANNNFGIQAADAIGGLFFRNNIVHDINAHQSFQAAYGIRVSHAAAIAVAANNIVYDIDQQKASPSVFAFGIEFKGGGSGGTTDVVNNTVHNCNTTPAASGWGIRGEGLVQNNIATDTGGDDYSAADTPATEDHNLSSDATAAGTGSLTSGVAADIYVSTTGGSEDLHKKSGAAVDPIDAGTDLGTSPTGVNISIDNWDRHTDTPTRDPWDMGADEFVSAVPSIAATAGAFNLPPTLLPTSVTDY